MKKFLLSFLALWAVCSMAPAQKPAAAFRVTSQRVNEKPVNPLIYGNFIELGLGAQIEGLWAEKLYNASLEEVVPFKENLWEWIGRKPTDDLRGEKWYHSGYEINNWYVFPVLPEVRMGANRYWNFHHGLQAAVLENRQASGSAFLAQDGIRVRAGEECLFRGYLSNNRTADPRPFPVVVTIGLYAGKNFSQPLLTEKITVTDGIFREYSCRLDPGKFSGIATFAISVEAGGTVAADGFSLMPLNSAKGWRSDVVDGLKRIGVPLIRFPGGCFASFYDWREGVGPRLDRQPVVSEYWGGIEENHAGTVEFVELCRLVSAEPFLCVNLLTGTADRAAQWVEYCNGSPETPMGALRKQHGYPEPLGVKYWEIDNETYRRFGWEEYAKKCVLYSMAMKMIDPTIKLDMIGYWRFNDNLAVMLEIAGKHIDVITDRATNEADLRKDLAIIGEYNRKNGTNITLSNTEWLAPLDWSEPALDALNFRKPPDNMSLQEHEITWNYAMNTARELLLFQRLGGDFEFACFNNLCNTWGQNIIESSKDTCYISAAGRIFELMSRSPVRYIHKTDTLQNLPGLYLQAGTSTVIPANAGTAPPNRTAASSVVIPAKASFVIPAKAGTPSLTIYVLNYRPDAPSVTLDLKAFSLASKTASLRMVYADGPLSSNSEANTNAIKKAEKQVIIKNPGKPVFTVQPWSVTEITLILLP
jgi:alpha-L-arabinofuranosidase